MARGLHMGITPPMADINPGKTNNYILQLGLGGAPGLSSFMPIGGYQTISLRAGDANVFSLTFADINLTDIGSSITIGTSWGDYTIPTNAVFAKLTGVYPQANISYVCYALSN